MKVLLMMIVLLTFAAIFYHYSKHKSVKKLFISLVSFGSILTFAVLGNVTRQFFPLWITHLILIFGAWGGLMVYVIRGKYYWWIIFSPMVTIGLFLLLEFFIGSGHESA